ncbi:TPA: LPXTG cell wall anchor domain-containing protein, partial [Streptococcus suis]|nr:LPXTG cell wall anchor domain-containing protein [Streptococcus suis]
SESSVNSLSEFSSESVSGTTTEIISESKIEGQLELVSEIVPKPAFPQPAKESERQMLPNTGEQSSAWTGILGAGLLLGAFYKRRKREEDKRTPLK